MKDLLLIYKIKLNGREAVLLFKPDALTISDPPAVPQLTLSKWNDFIFMQHLIGNHDASDRQGIIENLYLHR